MKMKGRENRIQRRAGLSMTELLVVVGVLAIIVLLLLPPRPHNHSRQREIKCANNLKNVGLAFAIFATEPEHNERFPGSLMLVNGEDLESIDLLRVYRSLSNELSTPRLLHCPTDTKREEADASINFDTMTLRNVSYFVNLTADDSMPQVPLAGDRNLMTNGVAVGAGLLALWTNAQLGWTKELHRETGMLVMGDGSVQQMSSSRLKAEVTKDLNQTNYVLIP
jgi:hypothetical protein